MLLDWDGRRRTPVSGRVLFSIGYLLRNSRWLHTQEDQNHPSTDWLKTPTPLLCKLYFSFTNPHKKLCCSCFFVRFLQPGFLFYSRTRQMGSEVWTGCCERECLRTDENNQIVWPLHHVALLPPYTTRRMKATRHMTWWRHLCALISRCIAALNPPPSLDRK